MKTKFNAQEKRYVEFLKSTTNADWEVSHSFFTLDEALVSINLMTMNSGWYTPKPIKIKGLEGIYTLDENKELNPFYRIIEKSDGKFEVQTLTFEAYERFEAFMRG